MKYTMMAFCMFLLVFSIIIPSIPVREASATPSLREGPFKMVAIGDSLMWGQGLSQFEKFPYLVRERLEDMLGGRDVEMTVLAHSGAVIGANQSIDINDPKRNLHGEIPRDQPTIRELMNMYTGDPQDVNLVLIDGCINDITGRWVAPPRGVTAEGGPLGGISFKDPNMRLQFREEISEFCYRDMKVLLQEAASKFNNRETRIVVTGYYQVISDRTDFRNAAQIIQWLTSGIELPFPIEPRLSRDQLIFNRQLFQMDSNRNLKRAVNEVNIELWNAGNQPSSIGANQANSILRQPADDEPPATGNPFQHVNPCFLEEPRPIPARIAFACPRYTYDNAMYAPNSFIFQLDRALAPTDSVRTERLSACDAIEHASLQDFFACNVASTGHANQNGALAYADAIMATWIISSD
jgi:hypothetical protein